MWTQLVGCRAAAASQHSCGVPAHTPAPDEPCLPSLLLLQGPNPQPLSIPFPQAILSLEPMKLKPPARVTAIAAGGDHSMAVTVAGALLAFGSNKHGQVRCSGRGALVAM